MFEIIKFWAKIQLKRIYKIITNIFSILGVLVAIGEGADEIFGYELLFQFYCDYFGYIVAIAFLISIICNMEKLTFSVQVADSPDVSITLKVCDALKNKGAVIIPTNSTFDTTMKDEFISKYSIQGQYQQKFYKNNLQELDKLIAIGITDSKYITVNDGRKTNVKRYPIGTVSKVNGEKKRAYFLADSDINKYGISENVDASDIRKALVSLWDRLSIVGNKEVYSIPLIGTGRAGVKNASRDEIVKEIVISFLAASREHKITENLIVCIHQKDLTKIHWDELCEFIKYQCGFANSRGNNTESYGVKETTPSIVILGKNEDMNYAFENIDVPKYESNTKIDEINSCIGNEERIISVLVGNKLTASEIAVAMGLSMDSTRRLLQGLIANNIVQIEGSGKNIRFTVRQ